ncbi:MAG: glutathione-dependent formaldehyde dehydrogenase [Proteobacteria bacterium]|nr:glutathione-dependent formaldehyde dehydrogenase [Pseudomonadota bacterium]
MRAVRWYGKKDVRVETIPIPKITEPQDILVKVTSSAICGSDLHLYNHFMMHLQKGDVLGHEFMGEVVEIGSGVNQLKVGDRVVVPFTISCGQCFFCQKQLYSLCDKTNPNAEIAAKEMGQSPAGLFGYTHMLGGYPGGQAEYVRVPYANVGPIKIPAHLSDEQVLFLSDIFPTGYMAAENADIAPGDTVAVWGCGPVGQFSIQSAWMFKAGRVIAIDQVPERLAMAQRWGKAEIINFKEQDVYTKLMEMTNGRGPDRCIDAVGTEASVGSFTGMIDRIKQSIMLGTDRPVALREIIRCCRKGGNISIPGVYIAMLDKIPFGAAMNKSLTMKMGQTHVQRYLKPLLERIERGEIDPSLVISHRVPLEEAAKAYQLFNDKSDNCIKVVLKIK